MTLSQFISSKEMKLPPNLRRCMWLGRVSKRLLELAKPSPGGAFFPHLPYSTWLCRHLSNQDWRVPRLTSGWLSETIRPGDSMLSSLLLHATFHLESISSVAAQRLTWGWREPREEQQGNRLCNVFGGVVLAFTVSADPWQPEQPLQ